MQLTVEFLGLARKLTQAKQVSLAMPEQATLRDVLRHLAAQYPALLGPIITPETFELNPSYLVYLDGRHAAKDLDMSLQDGQRLLFMFAEAGG
jgi:molybdopterin converting factor small subunit